MIPIKIKIEIMSSNNDGTFAFNGEIREIIYPLKYWKADSNYSMDRNTGKGKYFWTSQMFGGPKKDDMVLFENTQTPFYAQFNYITQDWDFRKGEIQFLFFKKDYWRLVKESLSKMYQDNILDDQTYFQEMMSIFGIDEGFEICSRECLNKISKKYNL